MTPSPPSPRRRGEERTRELLDVTLRLAAEVGYRGLTIEAIARGAGVGKHTIYRRWSSISELLLDALSHVWSRGLDYNTTGDIRDDLREQFVRSSRALSSPPLGPIYRAVITEAQSEERLRETIDARFLATVEQRTLDRIRLAQTQGQLRGDVDLQYPAEILSGTLYYRWLMTMRPVDEDIIDALIGMFIDAYGVCAPPTKPDSGHPAQP
ncbi:TetR/AcrR family transcriptional regulator [Microbacterium pseudoresistens]|uniref:AcrR family transcriptional regulator n=1 Tax=Microbacterium pseudoresistens TaxID=640634 RepID=A0A7Y9JND0_9MICO|nr:TetR/AcrR family transcriptional regulator [Microbacterium pseudoresistens]NYD53574.1 AcrR family transcriptional regulator [Microbacterium pseudoresistens]